MENALSINNDLISIIEILGPDLFVVEFNDDPGVHWEVRRLRADPPLGVWKRVTACNTTGEKTPLATT